MVALNFDLNGIEGGFSGPAKVVPEGWYQGVILGTVQKNAKAPKEHNTYLEITFGLRDQSNPYIERLNLWNDNPDAVESAKKSLVAILSAAGLPLQLHDTTQMHNAYVDLYLSVEESKTAEGKSITQNRLKAVRGRDGKVYGHVPAASGKPAAGPAPGGPAPGGPAPGFTAPPAGPGAAPQPQPGGFPQPGAAQQPWGGQPGAPHPQQPQQQPQQGFPQPGQQPAPQQGFAPPQGGFPAPSQGMGGGGFPQQQPQQGGFPQPQAQQPGAPQAQGGFPGQAPPQGGFPAPQGGGGFAPPAAGPWGAPQG